jgi:hypothetical protein
LWAPRNNNTASTEPKAKKNNNKKKKNAKKATTKESEDKSLDAKPEDEAEVKAETPEVSSPPVEPAAVEAAN